MFPLNRRKKRASLIKVSIALFAVSALCVIASRAYANVGDLYVTDLASGSVIVYAPDGTSTTFTSGLVSPQGIAFDQNFNLYVVDAGDGGTGNGTIFKYNIVTKAQSTLITGLSNPIGLALHGADLIVSENGMDRVTRVPTDGISPPSVFQLLPTPMGLSSHFFNNNTFSYIANGPEVLRVGSDGTNMDIDPNDGSRATEVSTITIQAIPTPTPGEVVFVSTDAGQITTLVNGVKQAPVATGIMDPRGMAFRPGPINTTDAGDLFVANTAGGQILDVKKNATPIPFATPGAPNYMVFQTGT
ncbi:MAG TPA: hypothetical protein VNW28_10630, partial [Chthoniobacterales bacterium]|nr:hypothetical protein [Chthoniobacterales bacterium]